MSSLVPLVLAGAIALFGICPAGLGQDCEEANTFTSTTSGFTICKPESWSFQSAETIAENRANARMKDKELEKLVRERASAPLVAITRFPEPYDDLNPSVQVMFRPLGQLANTAPAELMEIVIGPLRSAFEDFTVVEEIQETAVGGQEAAYMLAKYTVANAEGREFKTLSRLWIVPRGSFMFMISMSGPQEGSHVSEEEFQQVLGSIVIED